MSAAVRLKHCARSSNASRTLSNLPAATPANVRALVARCLTRDPRNRLQAIGEARIAIGYAIAQSVATAEPQQRVNGLVVRFTAERVRRWARDRHGRIRRRDRVVGAVAY